MKIRIACRKSQLAQIQAKIIGLQLSEFYDSFELVLCSTLADRKQDSILAEIGGKGLFVKEVEQALLDNLADIAVHSLKDMPVIQPPELPISAFSVRAPVNDVLIGADSLMELPNNAVIGTSSPRRNFQLRMLRPDIKIAPIRGNINTRLRKLEQLKYDAIVLAEAGLLRAKINQSYYKFTISEMLPAAGQAILAVQARPGFTLSPGALGAINCLFAREEALAEREILRYLGANCQSPLAVFARDKKIIVQAADIKTMEHVYLEAEAQNLSAAVKLMFAKIDKSNIRQLL